MDGKGIMAHISLSFGVKGGSSTAHGTSGGEIKSCIETICNSIEREVTTQMKFNFSSAKIKDCCKNIEMAVKESVGAISIEINDTLARQQIAALAEYAKSTLSNIPLTASGIAIDNSNVSGASSNKTQQRGSKKTQGNNNAPRPSLNDKLPINSGKTFINEGRVTVRDIDGNITNITQTYKEAETGVIKTQKVITKANGKVQISIAESTKKIISDIGKAEKALQSLQENVLQNTTKAERNADGGIVKDILDRTTTGIDTASNYRNSISETKGANNFQIEGVKSLNNNASSLQKEFNEYIKKRDKQLADINKIEQRLNAFTKNISQSTSASVLDANGNKTASAQRMLDDANKYLEMLDILKSEVSNGAKNFKADDISWIENSANNLQTSFNTYTKNTDEIILELGETKKKLDKAIKDINESKSAAVKNANGKMTDVASKTKAGAEESLKELEVLKSKVTTDNFNTEDITNFNSKVKTLLGGFDTHTEKTEKIISNISDAEEKLKNLRDKVEESVGWLKQDVFDDNGNKKPRNQLLEEIDGRLTELKEAKNKAGNLEDDSIVSNIEKETAELQEAFDVYENLINKYPQVLSRFEKAQTSFNRTLTIASDGDSQKRLAKDANFYGIDSDELKKQQDNIKRIIELRKELNETRQEIIKGENDNPQAIKKQADLYSELQRRVTEFTSANSAMQSSINSSNAVLRSAKNTIIQNNKVYSEAKSYYDRYRNAIDSNIEVAGRWHNLLNKMETGGFGDDYESARAELADLQADTKEAGAEVEGLRGTLKKLFSDHFSSQAAVAAIGLMMNVAKAAYVNVLELDKAMVELKKVTDETDASYARFRKTASGIAKSVGATVADTINSTADFARLGYSIDESAKLAEAALLYKNVGDGIEDISEASESIISTMKAFNIEASDAITIVDKFNIVGNNFAISSAGIGEALTRSAASLATAGNTLEESIALVTAANSVIQDPDVVGTALKTLSMYLRASKTEAEEAGIETDGMADSVSKLRSEIKSLTGGVDIMSDDETYKSTIQILREIADVWGDLSDVTKANLMEKLAGKRQGNVLASMLSNWQVVEDSLVTAMDSTGSAVEENEKYLDSIDGKINKLKASFEDLSSSIINSDLVKFIISGLNGVVDVLQAIDDFPLSSMLGDVLAISSAIALKNNGFGWFTPYKDEYGKTHMGYWGKRGKKGNTQLANTSSNAQSADPVKYNLNISDLTHGFEGLQYKNIFGYTQKGLDAIKARIKSNSEALTEFYKNAKEFIGGGNGNFTDYLNSQLKDANSEFNKLDESAKLFATNKDNFDKVGDGVENITNKVGELYGSIEENKAETMSWGQTIKSFALNAFSNIVAAGIGMAIQFGVNALIEWAQAAEKAKERADELVSSFNSAIKTANTNAQKTEEIIDTYERLSKGVDNLGQNVSLTNDEYEKYKSLTQDIAEMFPSLIKGYDEEGNAILNLKGNVEALRQAYEDARIEAYNLLIIGDGDKKPDDIVATYRNARSKENSAEVQRLENTEELTYSQYLEIQERYSELDALIEKSRGLAEGSVLIGNYQREQNNLASNYYAGINWSEQYSPEKFETIRYQSKSELQRVEAETESSLLKFKQLLNAYLVTNNDYEKLSEQGKKYASILINSIDESIADDIDKDPTSAGAYVVRIIEAFGKEDVSDAVSKLFDIDLKQGTSGEIVEKVDQYIGIIADALHEDEDKLKIRLGFEEPEALLTRAKNKFTKEPSFVYMESDDGSLYKAYNSEEQEKQKEIGSFLESRSLEDLDIAMQIDDLFEEGLDRAAAKIEKFKKVNLQFDYKDYSDRVDKIVEQADKIQTVIDSIENAEYIPAETITELATTFPDQSSKILAASGDVKQLKTVLDAMLKETAQPLIKDLSELDGLSEENQKAVNGLISILKTVTSGDVKKIIEYSDALAYLGTLSNNLDISKELTNALATNSASISQELLSSVKEAYPELNSYIETYLASNSKENAEALVTAYRQAYNKDVDNFFAYNQEKGQEWFSGSDWDDFIAKNTSWVDDFRESYDINLKDYTSYLEAVEAITKKHESDFDEYYKKATGGYTGYLPTSVWTQIRENFEGQYDDPLNEFWIKTGQHRLGEVGNAAAEEDSSYKDAFEKEYNKRKHWLSIGQITEAQFYGWLSKANQDYFAGKEEYVDEYRQYLEEVHSWEVEEAKNTYDRINKALDDSIDKAKEKIESGKLSLDSDDSKNVYKYYNKIISDYGEKISEAQKRIGYLMSNGGYINNRDEIDDLYKNIEDWNKAVEETSEESSKTLHDFIITGYKDAIEDIEKDIEHGEYSLKFNKENNVFQARNDEMGLLLKEREEIEKYIDQLLDKGYDETSDDIRSLRDEIENIDDDIYNLIKTNYEEYYQQQIDTLEKIKSETEDVRKEEELRLNIMKAQKALLDAQNNRNQLVFSGGKFSYEVDQEAVLSAMDEVKDAQKAIEDFNIDEQIDKLKKSQENIGEEVRNIFNWLVDKTDDIPSTNIPVGKEILDSESAVSKLLKDVMSGSGTVSLEAVDNIIDDMPPSNVFDTAKVESASNLQRTVTSYNGDVTYDNSVTVGDIHITVEGGTSTEMLQEFAEKVGSYFQQRTTQNNYAKR